MLMLKKTEAGFTLTELLVTLVIASIGILGVAGLQAKSLQLTRDANFRASAIIAANDLLDRVRVNSTQTYALAITDVPPAAAANCAATACTTAQLAAYDLARWACSVRSTNLAGEAYPICTTLGISGSLPLGASSISSVAGATGIYEVEVRWASDGLQTLCGERVAGQACERIVLRTAAL